MRSNARLQSAACLVVSILLAGIMELAVSSAIGIPGLGFVAVAALLGLAAVLGIDPTVRHAEAAERRVGELETEAETLRREVARLESPQTLVEHDARLNRMRRYGRIHPSHNQ